MRYLDSSSYLSIAPLSTLGKFTFSFWTSPPSSVCWKGWIQWSLSALSTGKEGLATHFIQFHVHITAFIHSSFLEPFLQSVFIENFPCARSFPGCWECSTPTLMQLTVEWGRQKEYRSNITPWDKCEERGDKVASRAHFSPRQRGKVLPHARDQGWLPKYGDVWAWRKHLSWPS